jgi:hypothetical protein
MLADFVIQSEIPIQLCCRLRLLANEMNSTGEFVVKTLDGGFNAILFNGGYAMPRFESEKGVTFKNLRHYLTE